MSTDDTDPSPSEELEDSERRSFMQGMVLGGLVLSHSTAGGDDGGIFDGLFGGSDNDGPGWLEDMVIKHEGDTIIADPEIIEFVGPAVESVEVPNRYDDAVRIELVGGNGFWTETAGGAISPTGDQPVHVDSTDVTIDRYREQDALDAAAGTTNVTGAGSTGPTVTLSAKSRIAITSETDASGAASSGSGTEDDPYIIDASSLDNSEATANRAGFYWDDGSATYHIRLEDWEIRNYDGAQIYVNIGPDASLTAVNGRLWTGTGAGNGFGVWQQGGDVTLRNVELAGCASHGVNSALSPSTPGSLTIEDCEWTTAKETWGGTRCIRVLRTHDVHVDSVTAKNLSTDVFLGINYGEDMAFTGYNWDLDSCGFGVFTHGGNNPTISQFHLTHFRISNPGQPGVSLYSADDVELGYGEVLDPPNGNRCVQMQETNGVPCRHVDVHHCYFEHNNGDGTASNEALFVADGEDVTFRDCWIGNVEEDGYELVRCKNFSVDRVGGNCRGQIVDIFGTSNWGEGEVRDVYGESREDVGVRITDADDVTVSGTLGLMAVGPAVVIEQRKAAAGAAPNDTMLSADLPPSGDVNTGTPSGGAGTVKADGRIGVQGDIGSNNLGTFYDNGIQRKVDLETY